MKVVLIIMMALISLSSCNHNSQQLRTQILDYCNSSTACIVEIKTITKFQWTKMFVFRYNATNEDIQKAIGINYPYYKEFTDRIIFLEGNEIVYHEDNKTNNEGIDKGDLIFNFSDTLKYVSFTPQDAIFKLNSIEGSNGKYYEMVKRS